MQEMTDPPYRALREAAGLSQRAVERALGWKTGHLSLIERGIRPSEQRRRELLAFLTGTLMGESGVRE